MRKLSVLLCSALLLSIVGCNGDSKSPDQSAAEKEPPAAKLSALIKEDTQVGSGKHVVAAGDTVWVTYTGKLLNGKQFDSNDRPDGMPYVLVIGNPGVIDGWKTGFLGMRAGGKRTLKIPASMGYGAQGNGPDIPPNTDLYFDVTLHEVVAKGEEGIFDKEDMKVGTGPAVRDGQTVTVKYTATLANGLVVDSSEAQGKAMTFKLGTSVASGLDAGIVGMKVGGKRKIKLPPAIAYGAQGLGKMIPPNSFLTYDVELESIK